jgi:hypothetical protein
MMHFIFYFFRDLRWLLAFMRFNWVMSDPSFPDPLLLFLPNPEYFVMAKCLWGSM